MNQLAGRPRSMVLVSRLRDASLTLSILAGAGATIYEPQIQEVPDGSVSNQVVIVGALFVIVLLTRFIAWRVETAARHRELDLQWAAVRWEAAVADRATAREAAEAEKAEAREAGWRTREEALTELSSELLSVVRTLRTEPTVPLRTMRALSAGVATVSQVALMAENDASTVHELAARTRLVLDAVEQVVKAVLSRPDQQISVNLMTLLRSVDAGSIADRLKRAFGRDFTNPYAPSVDGVGNARLVPWVAVLVSTSTTDARIDASVFLRIPCADALPGAPSAVVRLLDPTHETAHLAYQRLSFDDVPNTREIPASVEPNAARRNAMMAYFSDSALPATSFVSIALHVPTDPGLLPVGVLNVNCSEPGVFRDPTQQHLLLDSLRPILPHLARLASRYTSYIPERST